MNRTSGRNIKINDQQYEQWPICSYLLQRQSVLFERSPAWKNTVKLNYKFLATHLIEKKIVLQYGHNLHTYVSIIPEHSSRGDIIAWSVGIYEKFIDMEYQYGRNHTNLIAVFIASTTAITKM